MISHSDLDNALPLREGRVEIRGLEEKVTIHRDKWSIPHIRARSAADAFFAQGYVHAQDRLWQMDAARMRMVGRWAEWVGASGVEADVLARRLDVAGASKRDYNALEPESRAMLESYAAGVNAYLHELKALPLEYRLLGSTPEAWQGWHSIAVMRQRGYLMGSLWFKLWRAAALRTIGATDIAKLRYDDGGVDLLCIPPGEEGARLIASLQELAPAISAVASLGALDATGGGSNNWALSPSRTKTGRPLLAGDPHRAFEMPSMYVQTHLASDSFDVIGFTVPGVPAFPHFAHNDRVAWCVTHAFVDIHDLYVEQFSTGNAEKYRFRDEWRDTLRRTEQILVRDGKPIQVDVTETHHGPVIAGDPENGTALTLRSVQFSLTDRSFDCLIPMMKAASVDELFEATRGWGLIDHNLVAADTTGRIGHLVRAIVPIRPRINGWLPVPGWTGDYEWDGVIPMEDMPRAFDPGRGYIVTANNRVVADAGPAQHYLCTDCHPPHRARRIEYLLHPLTAATVEDMKRIHGDELSATAPLFQSRLAELGISDEKCAQIRDLIVDWDARMSVDSISATAYSAFRWRLAALLGERSTLDSVVRDKLAQIPPGVAPINQLWWTLPNLLRTNDASLLYGMTWQDAIREALRRTANDFMFAPWGESHRVRLAHPLSPLFPQAGEELNPGGLPVGGDNDTIWANGCYSASGLSSAYGAVARYVFDVGAWENSQWIMFHGVSGQPESPHYMDQHSLWAKCELVPMLYDWMTIEAESARLTLEPGA